MVDVEMAHESLARGTTVVGRVNERGAAPKVGLWETVRMAKHKFLIGLKDDKDNIIGARCSRCGKPTLFVHGQLPEEVRDEECVKEDFSQAAAKIVREATEDK